MDEMEALRKEIEEGEKLLEVLKRTPAQAAVWEQSFKMWMDSVEIINNNQIRRLEGVLQVSRNRLKVLEE